MKKYKLLLLAALLSLGMAGCHKTCTCYAYNGGVDEFSQDELDSLGYSCTTIAKINYGLTYSLCEW